MAIQIKNVKDATGNSVAVATSDLLGGGTLANVQYLLNGVTEVGEANPLPVSFAALPAGTNNIGDVDVLTVPADPFGTNADVASATGSISAKLRHIASTGIPVTTLPDVTVATLPTLPAGDNNIGNVDVVTLPALPTGSNVIGKVGVQVGGSDVGTTNPVPVRGLIRNPSATLTLPNSVITYGIGDLVANSATAGSVTPLQFDCGSDTFMITGLVVKSNRTATTTVGLFRLHLYSAAPTVDTAGDDGVYGDNVNMGSARYLGALDFAFDRRHKDGHAGVGVPLSRMYAPIKLASGSIVYGLVEARANYARTQVGGSSETMEITLDVIPATTS